MRAARSRQQGSRLTVVLGFGVAALVSEWIGHTVTWSLSGGTSPTAALSGSLHAYLEPLGLMVALITIAAAAGAWAATCALTRTARRVQTHLARGAVGPAAATTDPLPMGVSRPALGAPRSVSAARLWFALIGVQLTAYLVQENLEAVAAGDPEPHWRALAEHHGLPVLVHAAAAVATTAVLVAVLRLWSRRHEHARRAVAAYTALVQRRRAPRTHPVVALDTWSSLRDRFGTSLLSRPPPIPVDVVATRATPMSVAAGII